MDKPSNSQARIAYVNLCRTNFGPQHTFASVLCPKLSVVVSYLWSVAHSDFWDLPINHGAAHAVHCIVGFA